MLTRLMALGAALTVAGLLPAAFNGAPKDLTLLNVSYDPTRELYQEFDAAFAKHWKEKTGQTVTISSARAIRRTSKTGTIW